MKVVIVGAGNVATVLGRLIRNAGHDILQVMSRNGAHAKLLADELGCYWIDIDGELDKTADLYLIAVSDAALQDRNTGFRLQDKTVVHTAGSLPKDIFSEVSPNYGVMYPLQSLNKQNLEVQLNIPLLIDASTPEAEQLITTLAASISNRVSKANDEERLKLHVAAVIVNNFTNHLYALAANYCKAEGVNFNLLLPLIEETALRLRNHPPHDMQTGPAMRRDIGTLYKHLRLLANHTHLYNIYLKMTDSIMNCPV